MSFIQGLIHPPAEEPWDFRGTYFNKEEIGRTLKRFEGIPLCVDHDRDHVVGSVRSCAIQENGDIFIDAFVDDSTVQGFQVMHEIRNGVKKGLSMAYDSVMNEHNIRFSDAMPIEVSVVSLGAIPRSRIVAFGNLKEITLSKSGLNEVLKMENTTVTAAAPSPPALTPNSVQMEEHLKFINVLKSLNITPNNLPEIEAMIHRCKKIDVNCVKTAMDGEKGIAKFASTCLNGDEFEEFGKFAKAHLSTDCVPLKLMASAVQNFHDAHEREKKWREKYEEAMKERVNSQPTELRAEERKRPAVVDAASENIRLIESLFSKRPRHEAEDEVSSVKFSDSFLYEEAAKQKKPTMTIAELPI